MFIRVFKKDYIWTGRFRFDVLGMLQSPQGYFGKYYEATDMEGGEISTMRIICGECQ